MSDFRKGQLVAVRDEADSRWHMWIYDHASPEGLHFCRSPNSMIGPRWWRCAESAEIIWPDIFLADDRRAVEVLREECDRMKARADRIVAENKEMQRQIDYLCFTAGQSQCPPKKRPDCQHKGERDELFCAMCWLFASKKAVEEKTDG